MRFRFTLLLLLLGLPAMLQAQDQKPAPPVPVADDHPLPPGAHMRLGETRLRPGVRVAHLAFSADGKQLASWGNWMYFEDRLSVWDVATGKEVRSVPIAEHQIGALCWGPGRSFAVLHKSTSEARALDAFRIWSFTDPADKPPPPKSALGGKKEAAAEPTAPPEAYEHFALAPDGMRLAAFRSGGRAPTESIDLFEAKACTSGKQLKLVAARAKLPPGECTGLQLIRGGKAVAVLVHIEDKPDQLIVIWDPARDSVSEPVTIPLGVRQGQMFDVAEDGSAVAVGLEDGTVKIIELPSGKERLSVQKHGKTPKRGPWQDLCAVKFVNVGQNVLSAGRDGRQTVWNAQTGALVADLDGHESWVEAVAISPDGNLVATAGQDSLIRLWDARTWRPVLPPQGPRETVWRVEVSRDGKHAAAGSGDGVHAWELASGRELRCQGGDGHGDVLFAPAGELLAATRDGTVDLFRLADRTATPPKRLEVKGRLLDFTPDGKSLLTSEANNLVVWDWPAAARRTTIPLAGRPTCAAVAPDGKTVVVRFDKGTATPIVDLTAGKVVGEIPCTLHWFPRAAGFALAGRVLCGTVGRARAEMWDLATPSRVLQFEQPPPMEGGHFYILSFAVSADGRRSASCQSDGGVTVYETATGQVLAHFQGHRGGAIAVILTADGDRVLSGGSDHLVFVWDVSLRKLGGAVGPLSAAERAKSWDGLGVQPAKEAIKTMAALAADPEATIALLTGALRPVRAADLAVLDRIFRDLDDEDAGVRDNASDDLQQLGEGAIGGVRERLAKATLTEVRRRAERFLSPFARAPVMTPERLRVERALEVLAAVNTPAVRKLVETLAGGAAGTWMTEAVRSTLGRLATQ